jgi:hypothetical protein
MVSFVYWNNLYFLYVENYEFLHVTSINFRLQKDN